MKDRWKTELLKLLFPRDGSEIQLVNGLMFKFLNMPTSLYKYTSFDSDGHTIDNLRNGNLYLSKPSDFNDPYDCAICIGLDLKKIPLPQFDRADEYLEIAEAVWEKSVVAIRDSYIKSLRVSCFSEVRDSILMWSHYADYHRGVCIQYDFSELGSNHVLTQMLYPVFYQKQILDGSHFLKYPDNGVWPGRLGAITKADDWEYEREWRIVEESNFQEGNRILEIPNPKAIYLGVNILDDNKRKIIQLAEEKQIKVYQMKKATFEFKLCEELLET